MAPIQTNDVVLGTIAKDFGRLESLPGIELIEAMLPVVQVELYRRRLGVILRGVTPSVGAGTIKWTFEPKESEAWRVFLAVFKNPEAFEVRVTTAVDFLPSLGQIQVGLSRIRSTADQSFIGAQAFSEVSPDNQDKPEEVIITPGNVLIISAEPTGANNWTGIPVQLGVEFERTPRFRSIEVEKPRTESVP